MSRIAKLPKALLEKLLAAVREAWATEPTRVLYAVSGVIVFVFAKFGVPLKGSTVLEALEFVVPLVLAGAVNRAQVQPKVAVTTHRVISRHEVQRTAEAELARLWKVQADARAGSAAAGEELATLGITPTTKLGVRHERKRRFKWAVCAL